MPTSASQFFAELNPRKTAAGTLTAAAFSLGSQPFATVSHGLGAGNWGWTDGNCRMRNVAALAAVGLLLWLNVRDYGALGFIGCVALFACVYLIGSRTPVP